MIEIVLIKGDRHRLNYYLSRIAQFRPLIVIAIGTSCARESTDLVFESGETEYALRVKRSQFEETLRENIVLPRIVIPQSDAAALHLEVAGVFSRIDVGVGVSDSMANIASVNEISVGETHTYIVPLYSIRRFDRVEISVYGASESFSVRRIGMALRTFEIALGERSSLDTDIDFSSTAGNPLTSYEVGFDKIVGLNRFHGRVYGIEIRYRYQWSDVVTSSIPSDRGEGENLETTFELQSANGSIRRYRLVPSRNSGNVVFYEASSELDIARLKIVSHDPDFSLISGRLIEVEESEPIPADFSVILDYDISAWRHRDYEVFRWNIFPSFLVMDTRSYSVQTAFFRRLAFFVEKNGFAGRVLTNEELVGKFGWNAHDYRAEDLATFFNRIDDNELNREELILRSLLLSEGVISTTSGKFTAGGGGIISISRESAPGQRDTLIHHEGYHGVFFSDEEYRNEVQAIWAGLDPKERLFWRRLLENMTYSGDSETLLVNEFQSYINQQSESEVGHYFLEHVVPRFKNGAPQYADFIEDVIATFPDTFEHSAAALSGAVYRSTGMIAGSLYSLVPAP